MLTFVSLVFATFISEDLACVTAGLLIERGDISVQSGILACTLGIFLGDIGLWIAGRVCGRAVLRWPRIARWLAEERSQVLRRWLERHAAGAIIGSRFLPGSRLPLYVIAGLLRVSPAVFVWWALVGTVLWTPLVVLSSAGLGGAFIAYTPLASGWVPATLTVLLMVLALRVWKNRVGPCVTQRALTSRHDVERGSRLPLDLRGSGSG